MPSRRLHRHIDQIWRCRERLLTNPQTTIEQEYGLADGALSGLQLSILEEQPGVLTLPIPAPSDDDDVALSDEQLEAAAGGGLHVEGNINWGAW